MSVLTTINYIAASAKVKIQMTSKMNQWTMNLNTYAIFIGPQCSGKTPCIKTAVVDPLRSMTGDIIKNVKMRLTMSAICDDLMK